MQNVKINLNNCFKRLYLVMVFLGLFSFYGFANAATLSLSPSSGNYNIGDNISVRLYVNSQSEAINAVSANLVFSKDTLSLSSISKSGSIINFWAVDPKIINSAGQANLDGVAISGFSGQSGTVVTLNFRVINEGSAYVRFANANVLANDGQGTNVLNGTNEASFTLNKSSKVNEISQVVNSIIKKPEAGVVINQDTIKVEEIRSIHNAAGRTSFFIIPTRSVKDNTYDIQIDSNENFSYTDEGFRVYQTEVLGQGDHTIKVTAYDTKGRQMSGISEFTILADGENFTDFKIKEGFTDLSIGGQNNFNKNSLIVVGLLVLILITGFIRIRFTKKVLAKNVQDVKKIVTKTFNLLEEDEDEEGKLIRKLKNRKILTEDDESNINQFSKDLSEAEKVINESLNNLKND